MLAIVGGGLLAALATSDRQPVPITVGGGVSFVAPPDWSFVSRVEPPADGGDAVLLTRGVAGLLVYTAPESGPRALAELRAELLASPMMSVGDDQPADAGPGVTATRFAFSGVLPELAAAPIEGEATAVQGSTLSVVFFGWADVGDYHVMRHEILEIISRADIP